MGAQAAKYVKKGVDYVTGSQSEDEPSSSSAVQLHSSFKGTPFVLTRTSSMYFDEDGHLAHEFYRESYGKAPGKIKFKKITKGLKSQGKVRLEVARLHVDFPIVMYEG